MKIDGNYSYLKGPSWRDSSWVGMRTEVPHPHKNRLIGHENIKVGMVLRQRYIYGSVGNVPKEVTTTGEPYHSVLSTGMGVWWVPCKEGKRISCGDWGIEARSNGEWQEGVWTEIVSQPFVRVGTWDKTITGAPFQAVTAKASPKVHYHITSEATYRTTVCAIEDLAKGKIGMGWATCMPGDTFSAKEGRKRALAYAEAALRPGTPGTQNERNHHEKVMPMFAPTTGFTNDEKLMAALRVRGMLARGEAMSRKREYLILKLKRDIEKGAAALRQAGFVVDAGEMQLRLTHSK